MNTISVLRKIAWILSVLICLFVFSGTVLADDQCEDPIAQWQSREVLKAKLEQQGWLVKRIRIDDGCYEVRAMDEQGRRVKATFAPASLTLLELEVKHNKQTKRDHEQP